METLSVSKRDNTLIELWPFARDFVISFHRWDLDDSRFLKFFAESSMFIGENMFLASSAKHSGVPSRTSLGPRLTHGIVGKSDICAAALWTMFLFEGDGGGGVILFEGDVGTW